MGLSSSTRGAAKSRAPPLGSGARRPPGDRVSLYVCPECGDVGCGAVTLKVEFAVEEVIWSDFGYENNFEESIDRASYSSMGPFRFSRQAYEDLMSLCKP
jgi:hypothetical protein